MSQNVVSSFKKHHYHKLITYDPIINDLIENSLYLLTIKLSIAVLSILSIWSNTSLNNNNNNNNNSKFLLIEHFKTSLYISYNLFWQWEDNPIVNGYKYFGDPVTE